MAPANPVDRRILEGIAASLRVIAEGDDYFTTPDVVDIVDPPANLYLKNYLDKTVLFLVHEEEDTFEEKTGGGQDHEWEVFITAFYRWRDVAVTDPIRRQINRRLLKDVGQEEPYVLRSYLKHDIQKRMEYEGSTVAGGTMLVGLAENIQINSTRRLDLVQYNLPEWVGIEMAMLIKYSTALADPTAAGN